ncbi:hypothetical protein CK230_15295 [Mesorhizobium sp. WSM3859]|nr:hypothetical protein CK230_15295 [Mesorhizobium sp. WSM3859]
MTETPERPENARSYTIQRLMEETGISVEEAQQLIFLLGFEWSCLLREGHIIAKRKRAGRL